MSLLVIRLNISIIKSSANSNLMAKLVALRNRARHCKRRNYKGEQEEEDKRNSSNNFLGIPCQASFSNDVTWMINIMCKEIKNTKFKSSRNSPVLPVFLWFYGCIYSKLHILAIITHRTVCPWGTLVPLYLEEAIHSCICFQEGKFIIQNHLFWQPWKLKSHRAHRAIPACLLCCNPYLPVKLHFIKHRQVSMNYQQFMVTSGWLENVPAYCISYFLRLWKF